MEGDTTLSIPPKFDIKDADARVFSSITTAVLDAVKFFKLLTPLIILSLSFLILSCAVILTYLVKPLPEYSLSMFIKSGAEYPLLIKLTIELLNKFSVSLYSDPLL